MLKLIVNLDTDLNLDIGEETVLNYKLINWGVKMERVYTIPLRNVKEVKRTIRAPRAIREIKIFLTKHMKASEVKIDESINHVIWARGIQKIPSKITVKAVKDDDGVVKATLAD